MIMCSHPVSVKRLPATLSKKSTKAFLSELRSSAETERPSIVIDCSALPIADRRSMHFLLCCLEEAMKHKGDVKLVAVPDHAKAAFDATGLSRIFELFDTEAEAVSSFQRQPSVSAKQRVAAKGEALISERAVSYSPLLVVDMIRSEQ
jgi:anti-sigma B factor antagonist